MQIVNTHNTIVSTLLSRSSFQVTTNARTLAKRRCFYGPAGTTLPRAMMYDMVVYKIQLQEREGEEREHRCAGVYVYLSVIWNATQIRLL